MRGKVLEAMSKAKAVVSTPLGIQGITAKDQEEVVLAEKPRVFADVIIGLLRNKERRRNLGCRARALVCDFYDERRVFEQLSNEYRGLLGERSVSHEQ
jgi:glycosyltransferase involved in cell wall biosynthesis